MIEKKCEDLTTKNIPLSCTNWAVGEFPRGTTLRYVGGSEVRFKLGPQRSNQDCEIKYYNIQNIDLILKGHSRRAPGIAGDA